MVGPRTDSTGPRPLASVEPMRPITPIGDLRQEGSDRLARLEVGKQFQAQILSRFDDGTFMVRIGDASARIALPNGGQVGDGLELTLLSADPRPTFSLDSLTPGSGAANLTPGGRIAQALYLANAIQASHAPGAGAPGSQGKATQLSETGRLIADLLSAAEGTSTALTGKVPLTGAAGAGAPQLASALQDTLTFSGLFYESHVYQWANGERPLTDLLREPQARNSSATASGPADAAALASTLPPEVLETRRNLLAYFSAAGASSGGVAPSGGIDASAAQMINLQLNTLEQQKVQWQGELWPGQTMQWEVRRDDQAAPRQQPGAGTPEQRWQSVVRFTLPSLGVVSATINLCGDRVQIQVRTASESAAAALRSHGPQLGSALDAAGSFLDALTIQREGSADGSAA